jgi:hypothetical protein|eukprot:COSAG06_NODE_9415_length_1907_cov_7.875000_2_plen_327_part_00
MNARHPSGVDADVRHGASGVDIDGAGLPTFKALQPSIDLGRSGNANVNSRVVQARKALATGRRQAVALSGGGGGGGGEHQAAAAAAPLRPLSGAPPPVRRPAAQSPVRARAPPPPGSVGDGGGGGGGGYGSGGADFRKMLDARKAEAATAEAQMSAALHAAVRAGDAGSAQRLIDSGASVNTADSAGRTPLLNAADAQTVSVLVAAGARYTQGVRGGTGGVRQLKLGEVEGGLGVYTVDDLKPEPERLPPEKTIEPSDVAALLQRAALQEEVASARPDVSATAAEAAALAGASNARARAEAAPPPLSFRLPGDLEKMSERGREQLR